MSDLPWFFRVVAQDGTVLFGPDEGWSAYSEAKGFALGVSFERDMPINLECSPDGERWKVCGRAVLRELGHLPDFIETMPDFAAQAV